MSGPVQDLVKVLIKMNCFTKEPLGIAMRIYKLQIVYKQMNSLIRTTKNNQNIIAIIQK